MNQLNKIIDQKVYSTDTHHFLLYRITCFNEYTF